MTCKSTPYKDHGRWRAQPRARAILLAACLSLTWLALGAQGLAQTVSVDQVRQFTPAQRVLLFQDGVDAYRLGQYRNSFDYWLPLARAGDRAAQRNIAHLWMLGLGVQKSLSEAIPWFKLSAEGGIVDAYTLLGLLYATHPDVARDYEKAATYFYLAARQYDARAQYNLGLMYELGLGVKASRKTAAAWYQFAARAGHARAAGRLAALQPLPGIAGGFPPAPEFGATPVAGSGLPRVIDRPVSEKQRALDELVGEISRSTSPPAELEEQTAESPRPSSDDPLSALAANIAEQGAKARDRLPSPAFIDDTGATEVMDPAARPDTPALTSESVGAADPMPVLAAGQATAESAVPAPAPKAALPVPEELRRSAREAVPANAPVAAQSDETEETDEVGTLAAGQATAESAVPAPAPEATVKNIQMAFLPRPNQVQPKPSAPAPEAALPVPEELGLSRQKAVPADAPVWSRSNENREKENILPGHGEQIFIAIRPAANEPADNPEVAPARVIAAVASGAAVRAGEADAQTLPQARSAASVAMTVVKPGEPLIATDAAADRTPPSARPKAKPEAITQPALAGEPVQVASVPKTKRPVSVRSRQTGRQSGRAVALAAYRRGDASGAFRIWSALAVRGDVVSKFWLGRLYNRGEGVSRDPVRAYELFKSAARSGYSPAATALANIQARMTDEELKDLERALSSN